MYCYVKQGGFPKGEQRRILVKLYHMKFPNNIYLVDHNQPDGVYGESSWLVVIAASDIDTARMHVKAMIGIDAQPILLMGAHYPTIYTSDGRVPKEVQCKILYTKSFHKETL